MFTAGDYLYFETIPSHRHNLPSSVLLLNFDAPGHNISKQELNPVRAALMKEVRAHIEKIVPQDFASSTAPNNRPVVVVDCEAMKEISPAVYNELPFIAQVLEQHGGQLQLVGVEKTILEKMRAEHLDKKPGFSFTGDSIDTWVAAQREAGAQRVRGT